MTKTIEKITKFISSIYIVLSFVYIILVLLNLITLIFYFQFFNIKIMSYLDFQEVILSFSHKLLFCYFTILIVGIISLYKIKSKIKKYLPTFMILIFVLFLFLTIIFSIVSAWRLKNTTHNLNISITLLNGNTIKSTKTYKYIGKTKNYVFYYNTLKDVTIIYPVEQILNISIGRSLNNWFDFQKNIK
jgi:hypothetical protein